MAQPKFRGTAHLAKLLSQYQTEIVSEWRFQAGKLLRDLHLNGSTITGNMPDIVAEITNDLALCSDGLIPAERTASSGTAYLHGTQRALDGLSVGEVVSEYNLLRNAFATVAEQHGACIVGEAGTIINHYIDEAVRYSVTAYAEGEALLRKEREDDHLAFITHDLLSPLNSVSLLVVELTEGFSEKVQVEFEPLIASLRRNLLAVETLIKRVLETNGQPVTRAESSFHQEKQHCDLSSLVERLILDLRPITSKMNVEVIHEIPASLSVHADPVLLLQVFQNLLTNAFRSSRGGRVVVRAHEEAGNVVCVVQDSGSGIPDELLPTVFDKKEPDPENDNAGLALAIVKGIVEAHGGTVGARTSTEGSMYTFTIPAQIENNPLQESR